MQIIFDGRSLGSYPRCFALQPLFATGLYQLGWVPLSVLVLRFGCSMILMGGYLVLTRRRKHFDIRACVRILWRQCTGLLRGWSADWIFSCRHVAVYLESRCDLVFAFKPPDAVATEVGRVSAAYAVPIGLSAVVRSHWMAGCSRFSRGLLRQRHGYHRRSSGPGSLGRCLLGVGGWWAFWVPP